MRFRKDHLKMIRFKIGFIVIFLAWLIIMILSLFFMPDGYGYYVAFGTIIALVILLLCLFLIFKFDFKEYILINEKGISCYTEKETIWTCEWSAISRLKEFGHLGSPAVSIWVYGKGGKTEEHIDYYTEEHIGYFELSKKAKEALALYGKTLS